MLEIRMESKELDVLLHPNLLTFTGIWLKLVVAAEPANHFFTIRSETRI